MKSIFKGVSKSAWIIIGLVTIIKLVLALIVPLSNDEVYYHTYALYPALSHFDHPPMVGWIIQLFTFNMHWHDDFFMRLGSIVFSVFNSLIVYHFMLRIADKRAGFIAVILFNASFYNSIVAGFFIMPDTGLMTFWLLSLDFFHRSLTSEVITKSERKWMLLAGLFVGIAILSKYQAIFLWFSAIVFILVYRRKWLKEYSFYLSGFITMLFLLPVLIWNLQNDFVSFSFQGQRANFSNQGFNYLYFSREFFGQMLYTNIAVYVLIIWSLIYYKRNFTSRTMSERFFVYFGLPSIVFFLLISFFKSTLPHWSGPGFSTLILLASILLANTNKCKIWLYRRSIFFTGVIYIVSLMLIMLQLAINIIPLGYQDDPTSDITGWEKLGSDFSELRKKHLQEGKISKDHVMLSYRWFPAAHYDYYLAEPNQVNLIVTGDIDEAHKYLWINKKRGGIPVGSDAYYITPEPENNSAQIMYGTYFDSISPPDPIVIHRNNKPFVTFYLYILHNYKNNNAFQTRE